MLFMLTIQIAFGLGPGITPHALIAIDTSLLPTFLLLALTHALFAFDNNLSLGITYPFSHQRLVQSAYASSFITLKCFYILCHQDRILHEVFPFLSSSQGQVPSFVNPICLTGSTIATTLSCYSVSCI